MLASRVDVMLSQRRIICFYGYRFFGFTSERRLDTVSTRGWKEVGVEPHETHICRTIDRN
jgi:hypothetical protein